jgi:hypothetical protein
LFSLILPFPLLRTISTIFIILYVNTSMSTIFTLLYPFLMPSPFHSTSVLSFQEPEVAVVLVLEGLWVPDLAINSKARTDQ